MKLTQKYPLFIVATVVLTGLTLSIALTLFATRALEGEITKRGLALAQMFSDANAALLLAGDKSKLQLGVNTLAKDADVVDVVVVNHRGFIVAAKDQAQAGAPLADFSIPLDGVRKLTALPPSALFDPEHPKAPQAFGFIAPMEYGNEPLGWLILKLSRRAIDDASLRATLYAVLIGVAVALAISLGAVVLVRTELRLITDMQGALAKQAQGQFGARLPSQRRDELGDLARAFNSMSDRIELFFHYVDRSIVDRLVADPALAKPGGQLKEMAVVFGDMRGYTAMSNRRTAQEVVRIINAYFYLFIEIVRHFHGVVDKTMGDAVMAVFERQKDDGGEDYKRRAVLATAYMKASTVVLNRFIAARLEKGEELHFEPCAFGFAMASGTAIVGNMGSRHRMDYTVCGRVVNLASRLENETARGEVVIDNFTRYAAQDILELEALATVQPKGFSTAEKVTPHRVVSLAENEIANLRRTLKRVFSEEFFADHIVPESFAAAAAQQFVHDARLEAMAIIAGAEPEEFFTQTPLSEL